MALDLGDCVFFGHAFPEPFVKMDLEGHLDRAKLLPKTTGPEAKELSNLWDAYRRKLRALGDSAGPVRVANHVFEPLTSRLGYATFRRQAEVITREGPEDGGYLFETADGAARLRAWAVDAGADLDAPTRRGHAYRYSPSHIAQRVLLEKGERVGLLTDGEMLRVLLCDPARTESAIAIRLGRSSGWRGEPRVPDSYRLLVALGQPAGVAKIPELVELARLSQTRVTAKLREQARQAIQSFVQEVLDDPKNRAFFAGFTDKHDLAERLFRDALVLVYRLLFILKLDAEPDPARGFSFASSSLWRNTYAPSTALGPIVRKALDEGAETGEMIAGGLRSLFRLFQEGFCWSEMRINKLGGMLFGEDAAPLLDHTNLHWSEKAAAKLLDHLLWTPRGAKTERQRVHYGPLYVEDLGRVYEALLELEAGLATEPMSRLRRQKLEVVVPRAEGDMYRGNAATGDEGEDESESEEEEDEKPSRGKTRVLWVEDIREGEFYLRVGLGRKSTGAYYTPHEFVRFLIQETLGPLVEARCPEKDPRPAEILKLKVLDPAMGSGHFLVEACRYLGEKLYEACRACDAKAAEAERNAEKASDPEREGLLAEAGRWRARVVDLPDPNDEMFAYLPSRAKEGEATGVSDAKAKAIARRLVAVHCLYGVDKNPLAVELAKLSLWLESYAEGLPLTFLNHRLVEGDSLTGPFFSDLGTSPRDKSGGRVNDIYLNRLSPRLTGALTEALSHVRDLEASIGKDVADVLCKRAAKERLDRALEPFKELSRAFSGGVMLGERADDAGYEALMEAVAGQGDVEAVIASRPALAKMVKAARNGVSYDLTFPEVFHPEGDPHVRAGFHAVVGNPPWDAIQPLAKEFYAAFDLRILDAPTRLERGAVEKRLAADPKVDKAFKEYVAGFDGMKRWVGRTYSYVNKTPGGGASGAVTDLWQVFAERGTKLLREGGRIGLVLPSAFHANQSATGIRELFLDKMGLRACFSFENRNKLFEIHASFKFALVVGQREPGTGQSFDCAFYLHDLEWLFGNRETLCYTRAFVEKTGGAYLSLLELRTPLDAEVAKACFDNGIPFGVARQARGINVGRELHMTDDSWRFTSTDKVSDQEDPRDPNVATDLRRLGYVPLHEGKTFHQYTDRWEDRPRYLVELAKIADKPSWFKPAQHFRLAFRDIASATNERTGIFCMLPPGVVCGNKAPCEREPFSRPSWTSLAFLAMVNTYGFDFILRLKVQATVNLFILDGCPVPPSAFERPVAAFLAHSALRLTCNHEGYAPLWKEQLGDAWREPMPIHSWPVLAGDDARWAVRAAIDAVITDAYGLTRDQYAHVLSSFNHKSYPKAPERCLAAFDELKRIGLDAFVKERDPYADIPLITSLPKPVVDLSPKGAPPAAAGEDESYKLTISEPAKKRGRKKGT
ncbi:MAG: N-6 DNA methylase [Polyangiaceae bacterium]|nr:N-6 DNA methylase [Polyangiaceae bacterium]